MKLCLPPSSARSLIRRLITAGLDAADPYRALLNSVSLQGQSLRVGQRLYDLSHIDRVIAVGAGKASARMAQALEKVLGGRVADGLVIVKTGHTLPTKRIAIREASHPIPDRSGVHATQQLLRLIKDLGPRDLLFVLLSGGASSLLPAPVPGVTLTDKQRTTRLLLRSGATINEINVVRKHLSVIKGGGLATSTRARIVTLILSDVIGDDLGSIGSGPTVADLSTFADAANVLKRYRIWRSVPTAVRRYLELGQKGTVPETLKPGSRRVRSVHHQIIGTNRFMLEAVTRTAGSLNLRTIRFSTPILGEARLAARQLTSIAKANAD
ncbi:MAG: glycerate-2-kinase family protein, partial [Nitrospira sp.]|nr:glycerate-2-kinase family protein [Nitrospira sp.]